MYTPNSDVLKKLIQPILDVMDNCPFTRECKISDQKWVEIGISRVLSNVSSGRGFIQKSFFSDRYDLQAGQYFEALKSERRLKYVRYISQYVRDHVSEASYIIDKHCPELEKYDIHIGDGHHHKAPVHEKKIDGTAYTTQHFYSQNLRTEMVAQFALAEYGDTRKKEHDLRVLKRQDLANIRQGATVGRKVLWIWDRACMDFSFWRKMKYAGVYFLTLQKKSNKFMVSGEPDFDKSDPINFGIQNDEMISSNATEVIIRRVTYQCPESGEEYFFITNLPFEIRPGTIAFLYKSRWLIENTFNTFKHKLNEKKAWAVSSEAKSMQAEFICLVQNLSILLNAEIEKETESSYGENINKKHYDRKKKRVVDIENIAKENGRKVSLLLKSTHKLAELPVLFYRWLSTRIHSTASWERSMHLLVTMCRQN